MHILLKYISKYKYVIMSLIILTLVIILIFLLISANKDKNSPQASATTLFNQENLSEKKNEMLSGDSRFLVVCQEKSPRDVVFLLLIDFKIFAEKIIITPLSISTNTETGTFREKYEYGGISLLTKAVEDERKVNIDRYVILNKDGFCDIIDLMGEIDLYVDEDFTYSSSDKSYQIEIGNNTLEAPMLYSFLKIKYKNASDIEFTDLICKIVNTYLSKVEDDEALEYFEDLSNCINSNLSISDYYSAINDIKHIINGNTTCIPYYEGEQ